ncbi:hypothetical protein ILUMI_08829 [Ignelater luminosus]|uniref:Amidase domain-containing protein n=1 Tax=Ignelater luminosus TaxID=2038154 RepID=A0A8K0D3M1_IGNLU|nr:hypothetical protein ILUMI_08829 [Ignelater luminosus]
MCGLFGHKPTNGLISTKGLTYRTGDEVDTMVTAGTITKYSEDIIPFLKVLLGQNVEKLTLDKPINVKEIEVFYEFDYGDPKISPLGKEMRNAIQKTINYFMQNSALSPQKLNLPNIRYGGKLWRYWYSQESDIKKDLTDRQGEVSPYTEIAKFFLGQSEYNIGTISILINQMLPAEDGKWAQQLTDELRNDIVKKLGSNGVLIYPGAPWSARYHNTAVLRPWNFYCFAIWNALKLPVTQVPLGLDSEGLPIGIQVVAAPFQDHLCIAVARELEKVFGGYVPPFSLNKE